jgi:FkbM family methyltransferase
MVVSCLQKHEVPLVNLEIEDYFRGEVTLRPGDTVFDVGANIGLFSLAAYRRAPDSLRIYAFEPVPPIFELLRRNIERNTRSGSIEVLNVGLSRSSEPLSFTYYPQAPVLSTAYPDAAGDIPILKGAIQDSIMHLPEAPWELRLLRRLPAPLRSALLGFALKRTLRGRTVTCRMTTLSEVIRERDIRRIDLLKIDAEKAELDVLEGIEADHWERIRQVVVEVHDLEGRLDRVTSLLEEHGLSSISVGQPVTNLGSSIHMVTALRPR